MIKVFPFRYKLTLLITSIVILLLGAVFYMVQDTIEREFRVVIQRQLAQAEMVAKDQMQQRFDAMLSEAYFLQGDQLIRTILTNKQYDESTRNDVLISEVFPSLVYADFVIILDPQGQQKAITPDADSYGASIAQSAAFSQSLTGSESAGHVLTDASYQQFISMPVFLSDTMIGIVVVGKLLGQDDLQHIKDISDIDLGIIHNQNIILHTQWQHRSDQAFSDITAAMNKQLDAAAMAPEKTHELMIYDERFLARYVDDTKGSMPPYLLVQSLDHKLMFVQTIRNHLVVVLLLAIAGSALVAFIFSIGISRPIRILRTATAEIEKENFEHRVSIQTSDEFSQLADSFNRMIHELAEKQKVRDALNKSVSSDVAQHILNTGVKLGGERRDASVLFLDIRGFTSLSERLTEAELITLLNKYFTQTAQPIHAYHGTIDKFIGDAIMVLFGIPKDDKHHAYHSIKAAVGIMETLAEFNKTEGKELGVRIEIGVGINSGSVVAGMVGAEERLNYTALGDNVNLASRIEGLTKNYGAHIIITEYTYNKLNDDEKMRLLIRRLDCVQVKGKTEPCHIYEILTSEPTGEQVFAIKQFEEALDLMRHGNLDEALTIYNKLHEQWPDDETVAIMRERAQSFVGDADMYQRCYIDGCYIHRSK
ncbi:MAG: HAMP domain-containing protein [Rickettsiales bacterium]|nr:HAMP domain-containing protein [Rickettsiales bacterium]